MNTGDVCFSHLSPGTPETLKAETTRSGSLLVRMLIALTWNGILSINVWEFVQSVRRGNDDWLTLRMLLLLPFVAIGLVLIGAVMHAFLRLFSSRLAITIGSRAIRLGETTTISWELRGITWPIRNFQIALLGKENAFFRGTGNHRRRRRTYTARETFTEIPLATTSDPIEIRHGEADVNVPADSMHSFAGVHNQIVWALEAKCDVRIWPDVYESFPIIVLPYTVDSEGTQSTNYS